MELSWKLELALCISRIGDFLSVCFSREMRLFPSFFMFIICLWFFSPPSCHCRLTTVICSTEGWRKLSFCLSKAAEEMRINLQGEVVVWDLLLLGIPVSPWEHSLSEWIHRRLLVLCLGSYLTFLQMWQILSRNGLFLQSRSWENHSVPSSYFGSVFSTPVEKICKTCGFSFWLCHKLVLDLGPASMPLVLEILSHQSQG